MKGGRGWGGLIGAAWPLLATQVDDVDSCRGPFLIPATSCVSTCPTLVLSSSSFLLRFRLRYSCCQSSLLWHESRFTWRNISAKLIFLGSLEDDGSDAGTAADDDDEGEGATAAAAVAAAKRKAIHFATMMYGHFTVRDETPSKSTLM